MPTDPVNDPPADYSDTKYTYTPAGSRATVVDAAGNTWSYAYDLLGHQTSATDPDTGTTTSSYDAAGQLVSVTDARGKQTSYAYDTDGRKTAEYDTTGGAAESSSDELAAWTYDSVQIGSGSTKAIGYPATTTSYSGGDTYTQTVLAYNSLAKPVSVKTTLTGEGTALIPTTGYNTGYGYTLTGTLASQQDVAAGGLPLENVNYGYDQFGEPTSVGGSSSQVNWNYVSAVGYSEFGQPLQYTMPTVGGDVWLRLSYDDQTHAVTDAQTTDDQSATVVDDTSYSYANSAVSKGAGLVVSTTDKQNGGATTDTQCFTYDYATRLSDAWTATDNCAATPSPDNASTVGGPSPYWQSWTYDAAGDRLTQTDHDTSGNSANDTATTDAYPAAGSSTDQPHTLTSANSTGPNATANTASYTYDAAGNTTSITGGATGNQTLTWTDQNKLATDVTSAGTSSYVYDTDGKLVVRRDPGQTTFFFGDEQLVLNTAAGVVTGTRYYTLGGATIALRVGGGNAQYLIPDRQGTDQHIVDSATEAVTRRQYLPFGQTRGTAPTNWPGDKGYVGGTPDSATSLENLGAREYDPASGRFLSADPVFELTDPTQLTGYDYAGNDPVTNSDPTGRYIPVCIDRCDGGNNRAVSVSAPSLPPGAADNSDPIISISPHVLIHKSDPNYSRLADDWNKFSQGRDEVSAWTYLCVRDSDVCTGQLAMYFGTNAQGESATRLKRAGSILLGTSSAGIFFSRDLADPMSMRGARPAEVIRMAQAAGFDEMEYMESTRATGGLGIRMWSSQDPGVQILLEIGDPFYSGKDLVHRFYYMKYQMSKKLMGGESDDFRVGLEGNPYVGDEGQLPVRAQNWLYLRSEGSPGGTPGGESAAQGDDPGLDGGAAPAPGE